MAERNPAYDGFEAGIIIFNSATGSYEKREGTIVYDGEELLGGWARVYRTDRSHPSYEEVKFTEYDSGKALWNTKKATMIRKVALVHALREAFPTTFGGLQDESEIRVDAEGYAREIDDEPSNYTLPDTPQPYVRPSQRKASGTLNSAPEASAGPIETTDDPFGGDGQ